MRKIINMKARDRYTCGFDSGDGESQCGFVVYDRLKNEFIYVTEKRWKATLFIWVAKLFNVKVLKET